MCICLQWELSRTTTKLTFKFSTYLIVFHLYFYAYYKQIHYAIAVAVGVYVFVSFGSFVFFCALPLICEYCALAQSIPCTIESIAMQAEFTNGNKTSIQYLFAKR